MEKIEQAIRLAHAAGASRYWARRCPEAAAGLLKAAEGHSRKIALVLEGVGGSPIRQDCEPPFTRRQPGGERGA